MCVSFANWLWLGVAEERREEEEEERRES